MHHKHFYQVLENDFVCKRIEGFGWILAPGTKIVLGL